jgi:signal transduction histidine kinase
MIPQTIYFNSQSPAILKGHSGQFASALAHEVRNPLTNIKLSIQMLNSVVIDQDLKIYIDIIMRSSKRIDDLINELLTIQKVNEIHAEKYSMHELIDEVIESAKDRIKLKNVTVTKDFAIEDRNMILDRSKMKIALSNIIINAIDAMDPGKGKLNLVTKLIDGKYILLIKDNGCGISARNLKNIFKPYFTNKPGGLGIGLSTTYNILRANHVTINVESEEGTGTSFILLFDKKKKENE